ncbi:MAG: hypothetical protein R3B82_11600 [Sandaracinaceae bacterium]
MTIDPVVFLAEVGTEAAPRVFAFPTRTVDELEDARRAARGDERRALGRDEAVALMYAADGAEAREARRLRQRAERILDASGRGNRDASLGAELDFVRLWMSWRAGSGARAGRLAERFATRHRAAGILTAMAYMVRGEVAFADEDWDEAVARYRFALGQLGTPLYAYALYRTAHVHGRRGEREQGLSTLREVEQLGCDGSAARTTVRVAAAAATELSTGLRQDADGVVRPASCPVTTGDEPEDTGWHPAE